MLTTTLIHPQILFALARAGHNSRVLISDGNFPHATARSPSAELVFLNLAPGQLLVTDVLKALVNAIPIEAAFVMQPHRTGPYAMPGDPPIWDEFRAILPKSGFAGPLSSLEPTKFYEAARDPAVCLTVATGDQRYYANLLLTIGAVPQP